MVMESPLDFLARKLSPLWVHFCLLTCMALALENLITEPSEPDHVPGSALGYVLIQVTISKFLRDIGVILILQMGKLGRDRLSDIPKVVCLVSGRAKN